MTKSTTTATGTFEVSLAPLEAFASETPIGRMSIDKTFVGEMAGTSRGEMVSVRSANGSAGYVAMEYLTVTLDGKTGSFAMQHFGTMTAEDSRLTIEVVPGSGTDELEGISGTLDIQNEEGEHRYVFAFNL